MCLSMREYAGATVFVIALKRNSIHVMAPSRSPEKGRTVAVEQDENSSDSKMAAAFSHMGAATWFLLI